MTMRQQIPDLNAVSQTFKNKSVFLSETGTALVHQRISDVMKAGGLYILTTLAEDRGISLILMNAQDEIIDMSRFFREPAKDKRWKVPEPAWLLELTTPYRRAFSVEMVDHLREMIATHLDNGGSWETKLCNGYIEIVFYNLFGEVCLTQTIREK